MEFNKLLKATNGGSHEYIFAFLFQCLIFQATVYTFISFTIVCCVSLLAFPQKWKHLEGYLWSSKHL